MPHDSILPMPKRPRKPGINPKDLTGAGTKSNLQLAAEARLKDLREKAKGKPKLRNNLK